MRDWFITKLNDRLEFNEEKLKKVRKRQNKDDLKNKVFKDIFEEQINNEVNHIESLLKDDEETYFLKDFEALTNKIKKNRFKFVSFEKLYDQEKLIFKLSKEEFQEVKRLAQKNNGLLKKLKNDAQFIPENSILELNDLATEKYFEFWF